MRISDWSSDVCSSDLISHERRELLPVRRQEPVVEVRRDAVLAPRDRVPLPPADDQPADLLAEVVEEVGVAHGRHTRVDAVAGLGGIGRAECRGRVGQYVLISVVAVSLTKNKQY